MISNGKPTEEARLKEEESARDKKKMRRRLKRQEERERKESAAALDSEDSEDGSEGHADDAWADTDGSTVDETDALVKQFAGVGIRSKETPVRGSGKNGTRYADGLETPGKRTVDEPRQTPRAFKTPLREMTKAAPQSWDALVGTPASRTGKAKGTPKVGMTPGRTPGGNAAGDDTVPVPGGDRALRYLTPRPCHK